MSREMLVAATREMMDSIRIPRGSVLMSVVRSPGELKNDVLEEFSRQVAEPGVVTAKGISPPEFYPSFGRERCCLLDNAPSWLRSVVYPKRTMSKPLPDRATGRVTLDSLSLPQVSEQTAEQIARTVTDYVAEVFSEDYDGMGLTGLLVATFVYHPRTENAEKIVQELLEKLRELCHCRENQPRFTLINSSGYQFYGYVFMTLQDA